MSGNDSEPQTNARAQDALKADSLTRNAAHPDAFSFEAIDIGICIKDRDWCIKSQNPACTSICGNITGQVCQGTCSRLTKDTRSQINSELGIESFREKQFAHDACDVAIIHREDRIISILSKRNFNAIDRETRLRQLGLTNRELEIYVLRKRGYKNIEIEHLLQISHCTLKTHISHILRKLRTSSTSL
jgi:ATP/maltotriose-dependent transcriptional regulator MalT